MRKGVLDAERMRGEERERVEMCACEMLLDTGVHISHKKTHP
jgi:hypothetical protein